MIREARRGREARSGEPRSGGSAPLAEILPAETSGAALDSSPSMLPAWSTRGDAPGPHGCWALNKRGEPCRAARRGDGDYCNAHSGLGVAADPRAHAVVGTQRAAEARTRKAEMRILLGSTRMDSPRVALRAAAIRSAERLASSAINAATDPSIDPSTRGKQALAVIEAAEPRHSATLSASVEVGDMSLAQLMERAEALGISPAFPQGH
jgi:hypothetical protein